jgi:hypothetical protein
LKFTKFCLPLSALLVAACAQDGAPGAPGTAGPTVPPSSGGPGATASGSSAQINQVLPRVGLVDRTVQVAISFDGPRPELAGAEVDLGDGIEVADVRIEGGALQVELVIDANAPLGARDVSVKPKGGGTAIVAKEAFRVAVPLAVTVGAGKAEQGGLVRVDISNNDKVRFDTENFLLLPLVDPKTPSMISLANQGFTATDGSVVLLGDPLAAPGALGFLGINNPEDAQSASFLSASDAVTLAARKPVALASGTPTEILLEKELSTAFFSADLAPAANEGLVVEAFASPTDGSTMQPYMLAYPASGNAGDLIDDKMDDPGFPLFGIPATQARISYPVTKATKGFFVVVDASLGHGATTKASLAYSAVRAKIVPEQETAHGTPAKAQGLGLLPAVAADVPGVVVEGELKEAEERDYYLFTGHSTTAAVDMLLSVTSDADVLVWIDTVPTFDSDALVELTLGGTAGSVATSGLVGKDRYIRVIADGQKTTGKYSLGIKRIPQAK